MGRAPGRSARVTQRYVSPVGDPVIAACSRTRWVTSVTCPRRSASAMSSRFSSPDLRPCRRGPNRRTRRTADSRTRCRRPDAPTSPEPGAADLAAARAVSASPSPAATATRSRSITARRAGTLTPSIFSTINVDRTTRRSSPAASGRFRAHSAKAASSKRSRSPRGVGAHRHRQPPTPDGHTAHTADDNPLSASHNSRV